MAVNYIKGSIALAVITLPMKLWLSPADRIKGNNLSNYYFLTCLVLVYPLIVILLLSFISNGSSLESKSTIGYNGGYIVMVLREDNFSSINDRSLGHLWKNYKRLKVGLMPIVRLARTENSIKAELRTPHYSLVNPLIDLMKASETKLSRSCLRSES